MGLNIAIVDDDRHDRDALESCIRATASDGGYSLLRTYESADDMLAAFAPGAFDLVFLDVLMPDMDGLELAGRLRSADPTLLIVFVTTMGDYALSAYPTHPFDFLVKPWTQERLAAVLRDAERALGSAEAAISVSVPYGTVELAPSSIASVEARGHAVVFHGAHGTEVRSTMLFADATALVSHDARFLEVNRGVLVNMDHVVSVEGAAVKMDDGRRLPLRARDRAALGRAIAQHMLSRVGMAYRG